MLHSTQRAYLVAKAMTDSIKDVTSDEWAEAYELQLEAQDAMIEWAREAFLPKVADKAQFETVKNLLMNYKVLNLVRQEQLADITAKWDSAK